MIAKVANGAQIRKKINGNRWRDLFDDKKGKETRKGKICLPLIHVYKVRKPRRRRRGENERNDVRA